MEDKMENQWEVWWNGILEILKFIVSVGGMIEEAEKHPVLATAAWLAGLASIVTLIKKRSK